MAGTKWTNERTLAAFLLLITAVALAAMLLVAPVPLSLDGASHIYCGVILRHLLAGDTLYRQHFHLASPLIPNWLTTLATAALTLLGIGRWNLVVMNGLVIILLGWVLYFLAQQSGADLGLAGHRGYAVIILAPFAASIFILWGFWGFLISTALCFLALGLLQSGSHARVRFAVPVLILLAFWAHPVPVILTALIPVVRYLQSWFDFRASASGAAKPTVKDLALDLLPWFVAGLLIALFTLELASRPTAHPLSASVMAARLIDFLGPDGISSLAPTSTVGGVFVVFIVLLGVGAFAPFQVRKGLRGQLTVLWGVLLVLYLTVPDEVGNAGVICARLLWMAMALTGVMALSGVLGRNSLYLRSCALCAAIITVGFAIEYVTVSERMQPPLQELRLALQKVPPRSEALLLNYRLTPQCARWPILEATLPERHLALMAAMPRGILVLNDYEPVTGQFPVENRSPQFEAVINEFNFSGKAQDDWKQAVDSLDAGEFVVSWGIPSARSGGCDNWVAPPLEQRLQQLYTLLYESSSSSRVQVWQRRDVAVPLN